MKWHWRLLGLIWMIAASTCHAQPAGIPFSLHNPLDIQRDKEVVIITRAQYLARTHYIPTHLLPQAFDSANHPIPTQADDLNGDHLWDEIAMLVTLRPNQTARFRLQMVSPEKVADFPHTTRAWLAPYVMTSESTGEYREVKWARIKVDSSKSIYAQYQMGGVVVENDSKAAVLEFPFTYRKLIKSKGITPAIGPQEMYQADNQFMSVFTNTLVSRKFILYRQITDGPVRSISYVTFISPEYGVGPTLMALETNAVSLNGWLVEGPRSWYQPKVNNGSISLPIHLIGF